MLSQKRHAFVMMIIWLDPKNKAGSKSKIVFFYIYSCVLFVTLCFTLYHKHDLNYFRLSVLLLSCFILSVV